MRTKLRHMYKHGSVYSYHVRHTAIPDAGKLEQHAILSVCVLSYALRHALCSCVPPNSDDVVPISDYWYG